MLAAGTAFGAAPYDSLFVRVHLEQTQPADVPARIATVWGANIHTPSHVWGLRREEAAPHRFKAGFTADVPWKQFDPDDTLRTGESTAWTNVTEILSAYDRTRPKGARGTGAHFAGASWYLTIVFQTPDLPQAIAGVPRHLKPNGNLAGVRGRLELASAPRADSVLESVEFESSLSLVALHMPDASVWLSASEGQERADRAAANVYAHVRRSKRIHTFREAAENRLTALDAVGWKTPSLPRRMMTLGWFRNGWHYPLFDHETNEIELEVARRLGIRAFNPKMGQSSMPGVRQPAVYEEYGSPRILDAVWLDPEKGKPLAAIHGKNIRKRFAAYQASTGFAVGEPVLIKLFDEPFVPTVDKFNDLPEALAAFGDYLIAQGETARSLGMSSLAAVRLLDLGQVEDERTARLYYHSTWFRVKTTARWWKEYADIYRAVFGEKSRVTTCAGLNGIYARPDWLWWSRVGAWDAHLHHYVFGLGYPVYSGKILAGVQETTRRFYGIEGGGLLVPGRGHTTREADERVLTSALMRGFSNYYQYNYGPLAMPDADPDRMAEEIGLGRFLRRLLQIENDVLDGDALPPAIAIFHSATSEMWERAPDASRYGGTGMKSRGRFTEKEMIYTALAYHQYDADILPEWETGRLDQYKVLYLVDPHLPSAARRPLAEWVAQGGTLYASSDAGVRDEYNQPYDFVAELAGEGAEIKQQPGQDKLPWNLYPTYDLQKLDPAGVMTWHGNGGGTRVEVEVLARKESLTFPRGKVLATYADGAPAAVEFAFGKGRVVRVGTAVGLAYARSAQPAFKRGHQDTASARTFSEEIAEILLYPVKSADVFRLLRVAQSGVDARMFESSGRALCILVDYAENDTRLLDLTIADEGRYREARTLDGKKLSVRRDAAGLHIQAPVEISAYILLK